MSKSFVVDTNVIISALIREGVIFRLLMQSENDFYFIAAEFVVEEIQEHWERLKTISSLTDHELSLNYAKILKHIDLFNVNLIDRSLYESAISICQDIDLDDIPHVAMSLYFETKLWTGDAQLRRGLERKGYFICVNTREIIEDTNLKII